MNRRPSSEPASLLAICNPEPAARKLTTVQKGFNNQRLTWEQGLQRSVTLLLGNVDHLVPEVGLLLHHELQAAPRDDGRLWAVHQLGTADQLRQAPAGQYSSCDCRLQGDQQSPWDLAGRADQVEIGQSLYQAGCEMHPRKGQARACSITMVWQGCATSSLQLWRKQGSQGGADAQKASQHAACSHGL